METQVLDVVRRGLPDQIPFHYYAGREAPWLLAQWMPDVAKTRALRAEPYGKLLDRPLVREVVGRSGGVLRQLDMLALGHAERALGMSRVSKAGRAGLELAYQERWFDFELTFDTWATWQTTRSAGNLVVQMGFPSDHADLLGRYFREDVREKYQCEDHPVRLTGRPTLAWARLDLDPGTGACLIEEVQSDWLRFVSDERAWLEQDAPQSREARATAAYERALLERYGRLWPKAMMLAVLTLLRDTMGYREIWMHQHLPGARLKGVFGGLPPRSLYAALPKSFCFEPTRAWPAFLVMGSGRGPGRWRRSGRLSRNLVREVNRIEGPLFWRLRF